MKFVQSPPASSRRSPRRRLRAGNPAFALPPPSLLVAAAAAAAAAAATAAALLLAKRALHIRRARAAKAVRPPASAAGQLPPPALLSADADLGCEKLARQYDQLSAVQRRNLLAATIARAANNVNARARDAATASDADGRAGDVRQRGAGGGAAAAAVAVGGEDARVGESGEGATRAAQKQVSSFWTGVEALNGRAAALGFLFCLLRETVEPGHPSLFEQVVDVVVPIAQKTPPFVVAVVDRLADLLT